MKRILFLLLLLTSCTKAPESQENESYWTWEDHNIHYIEKGKGNNHILLLHGFSASTYTWRNQTDELVKNGYHVWAIDLLGFGLSDKPLNIPYSLELYRKQILDFMSEHKIKKTHLVGHSMGGSIALSLAIHAPNHLTSLTLVDPAGYPVELPTALKLGKKLGKFGTPFLTRATIKSIIEQLYFDGSKITEEQVDAYYAPLQMDGGKRSCMLVLNAFENEILEEQSTHYSEIKTPTILIWGENDLWIPVDHLSLYAKSMPKAKQVILKFSGHAPQEESPEAFNPPFLKFLKKAN